MARITGTTNESVYSIPKWLGLNEHPDGDTRLKLGEASVMENWRITRDGNLKRRPGLRPVIGLRTVTYEPKPDDTPTELGKYAATQKLTVYTTINVNSRPGVIALSGKSSVQAQTAAGYSGARYVQMNGATYKVTSDCWSESNGVYTLTAPRVRAKPFSSTVAQEMPETGGWLADKPVAGMWSGYVNHTEMLLVACDGKLFRITNPSRSDAARDLIGAVNTTKGVSFFPFDNKVYILNGYEYYEYNGTTLTDVEGYRPLVAIAISPLLGGVGAESGETTGEYVNRLNGMRRVWISPDGENYSFQMPEKNLASVDFVKVRSSGSELTPGTDYTWNLTTGVVMFSGDAPPVKGVNTYEIGYSVSTNYRSQVTGNLFAELFSGTQDTRVFLYGDGTNRALYSGMDTDGMPRADYFPDSYEVRVGAGNTKITSMVRHYSTLIAYKPNECWSLQHGIVELATDELTPAVYTQPVNRDIGNVALGQVRLVNNNPITLHRHELYDWSNSSYYTSNLSRDERQAKRISDKVQTTIRSFSLANAKTWDDNDGQEYYVLYNNQAIVWNYANNTWYKYTNFPVVCMCNFQGNLYAGGPDGMVYLLTDNERTDNGDIVVARWESGAMDFGAAYARKYCSMMWIGLKPLLNSKGTELETRVTVSVLTDRKDTFRQKIAYSNKARVDGEPFTTKIKLKAKKFVFYHLLLMVDDYQYPVTVTNVDFRVRQTGYAK